MTTKSLPDLFLVRRRILFAAVALLSAFFAFGTATAQTQSVEKNTWQDPAYIEHLFYKIALRGEYERLRPVVRKWNRPLKVWIGSSSGDRRQQHWLLVSHLSHLGSIVGLPVEFVPLRALANVRVYFTGEDTHEVVASEMSHTAVRALDHSICLGQIQFNRRGEITQGTVVVPVERAQSLGKLVPCVVEEITQLLGLINDTPDAEHSVFNDYSDAELLTGLDYVLLKLLYSPHLHSGMTIAQVSPVIRQHLQAWSHNGFLSAADDTIAQGPLHRLR